MNAKNETLSVVVTCFNHLDVTRVCINALLGGEVVPDEIILVDNGSGPDVQEYFENHAGVKYIRRPENDGSIIGRNVGMEAATCDRVLVIDNDQVVSSDTIKKYLEIDADVVGCVLCETDRNGIGREIKTSTDGETEYMGIGGLCIRRLVIDTIGYLYEGFAPAYCDDPDYFWRVRRAGFTWAYLPDSGIIHGGGTTLGEMDNRAAYERSHALLRSRWPDRLEQKIDAISTPVFDPTTAPLVSYVIPTFNRIGFICQCIDSILAQTYPNIEIIVVDDGSTDGTGDLIKEKYPQVEYMWHPNHKIPYTLNRGFRAARGKYVCWVSSDDGIFPEKTARQVAFMEANPDADLSFTEYEIRWWGDSTFTGIAGKVQHWKPTQYKSQAEMFFDCLMREICNMNGSTAMFRKANLKKFGYFIETLTTCQDWEMWLRYMRHGRVAYINENLGWRNEHNGVSQGICQKEPGAVEGFNKEKAAIQLYYRMFTDPTRPRVCAMLCVKNEEHEIERCLDHIILWADQIVIFNDGSTDRTAELAAQYPKVTNIFNQEDRGNNRTEGKDRQKLLEMAQATGCEWICFIDCDEVFEDKMLWNIYDMITDPDVNLYHFKELNFWRSETHLRVDELYDKGRFSRLFRNFPELRMAEHINEHCAGVPYNIPGAMNCFCGGGERARDAKVAVKHYGFSEYWRNVEKAYRRWVRDPLRNDNGVLKGGWVYYERMINETGLQLREYKEELL